MKPGETCQFEYTLNPANGDTSEMVACSSDASVAEISSDGMITAVGAGECEVFLIVGDIAASCKVTVSALDMTEAWLCESEYRGMTGESALICYAFNPENASPVALDLILPEALKKELEPFVKNEIHEMFKSNVTVSFNKKLGGGFKVAPQDGGYVLQFTDEEFNQLISNYLRPATKKILFG